VARKLIEQDKVVAQFGFSGVAAGNFPLKPGVFVSDLLTKKE
jgi:hypothetical protein